MTVEMEREWMLTDKSDKKIDIVRKKTEFDLCDLENHI